MVKIFYVGNNILYIAHPSLKTQLPGSYDSTEGGTFVLQAADLNSMIIIPCGAQVPPGVITEYKTRSKPGAPLIVTSKQTDKRHNLLITQREIITK